MQVMNVFLHLSQDTNIPSEEVPNDLQEKLNFYRKKAKVTNTERSTKNWITQFEEFRKKYNYNEQLEDTQFLAIQQIILILHQNFLWIISIERKMSIAT